jgi:capsular exopolysaccharide synthesis family protein
MSGASSNFDRGSSGVRVLSAHSRDATQIEPESYFEPRGLGAFTDEEEQEHALNLLDYVGIVIKWRWLIAGAGALGIGFGVASTLLTTPLYHATATVQIDHERAQISAVQSQDAPDYYDSDEFYQTQYALLRSRSLAQRVASNLNLANDGAFLKGSRGAGAALAPPRNEAERKSRLDWATGNVMSGLKIDPMHGSRLVHVTFQSPNPRIAAKIANAVAQNYIQANLEHRYDASNYARQFLQERLNDTRDRLETAEKALVAYAAQNQIINLDVPEQGPNGPVSGQTSLAASDLASVNQALASAVNARIAAEQKWRQASATTDVTTIPEAQTDPAISALIAARDTAEAQYHQDRGTMKPDHPNMLALQAKIDQENREIAVRGEAVKATLQNQYTVALRQEQSLQAELNKNKGQVLDQRTKSIQYNILQREVDTDKTLYDGLLQRYKEIGVAGAIGSNNISVVDAAQIPGGPFKPVLTHNIAVFAAVALGLGAMLAFLLERFDVSIKVPEDVERKLGLALLGTIPRAPRDVQMASAILDPRSVISEAYYSVRTALNLSTQQGVPRTLLITSARPSEGKTTTSITLARAFARLGGQVLLVDGDMRDPSLHRLLGRDNGVGLSNILSSGISPATAFQSTDQENLTFIPCGPRPPNPGELLSGEKLRQFLHTVGQQFSLVIIDGPPVLGLADAPLLADAAEGTLVVIEAGVTKRELARMAIHRLRTVRSHILGVVLSKFDIKKAGYSYGYMYGHGGGYGYGYDYGRRPKSSKLLGVPIGERAAGQR